MARVRSVDFLPEIFQTDANKQFLAATLDQLIQEPKFKKTQGYIGRTVGPGVNPNDKYVIEPDKTRADYQLEPGVISVDPADNNKIIDAITYPGITDTLVYQGSPSTQPSRLYTSDYYSLDPFIDFDTFVNFSQYYWVPDGPDVVTVQSPGVALSQNFIVDRADGVYTFSGLTGNNPTINLVRGGNYTFQVSQNAKETVNYKVTRTNVTSFNIDNEPNAPITLIRGNTYTFNLFVQGDFPFWIKTAPTTGTGDQYNSGVTRNGSVVGTVTFTVPQDAPNTLYYSCQTQSLMRGTISVIDAQPGDGPGFWIQTAPGVNGLDPTTPNVTSRSVYGVTNNGIDLGTLNFNVPQKTAQDFFYNLVSIGSVDLVTDLFFNNIDGARLDQFIATYGGIDGITDLNTRTLVFANSAGDPSTNYYSVWRISYVTPVATFTGSCSATTLTVTSVASGPITSEMALTGGSIPVGTRIVNQLTGITGGAGTYLISASVSQTSVSITGTGYTYLSLGSIQNIANLEKWTIRYGTEYSSTQWYKNQAGYIVEMPQLTAKLDTLYYQDGTDPEIFGTIRLIEQDNSSTIYIEDVLGKTNYTSPNGVTFTNGLKVQFLGNVSPASYATGSDAFICTNTAAGINLITTESTAGMAVGQEIIFNGTAFGGVSTGVTYYVQTVFSSSQFKVSTTKDGTAVTLTSANGNMVATTSQNPQYYVSGVGTAIELLPVTNYITPEEYASANDVDYLTINRDSPDLNAWSRSNRWFHIDVLNVTGAYNDTPVVIDNDRKGKRPIIQFRGGIRLYNMGTEAKQPVNVIDFTETDAFSNIEGSTGYSVNDYTFVNGSRVIFAADEDQSVRRKIYVVNFIVPDTVAPLITQPIINLVEASDGETLVDQTTTCISGSQVGITYWYDGVNWLEAQQKTAVQQAPLFDIFDADGISLSNKVTYPSSTFTGTKLFSYATGAGTADPVLQLVLKYLSLTNVGDIVFDNNLYADSFVYVRDNVSTTAPISLGFVYEYASRTVYERLIGWQTAVVPTLMRQQFKFVYNLQPLQLDVAVQSNIVTTVPSVKVLVGSIFQDPGTYTVATTTNTTTITFNTTHVVGDVIEVEVLSDQISQVAFYQVPLNLNNNPLNANSPSFTLGTLRTHYDSICQNLTTFSGSINGANNTRDLGNVIPYGQLILQQSSPLTLAGYFMRSQQYNIFGALEYNSREYQKYKNQLLEAVTRQTIQYETTSQVLDTVIAEITLGRTENNPFYWSDMLPATAVFTTSTYTVSYITRQVFDTVQVYNYTTANYLGMNVYVNDQILTRDLEYTVATDGPRIEILITLAIGDTIVIQEYSATYGTYVPNTPSKMGLYPAWQPEILPVKTSAGEQLVILGHDGSQTPIFGDIRDEVLLEFETRIYNNIKLDGNPVPLDVVDVLPGQFRDTGYSYAEINTILETSFLTYVGWNKLDYTTQNYNAGNPFTYNYSSSTNKLNNENLLGAWRGINRYFYDTQQPELTPWEMIGFSVQPDWWEITYGPAPYTSDNMNLWDDLELGLVRDPVGAYTLPAYARPGLTSVLPTDSAGNLLAPLESVVGRYNPQTWQKSWAPGDGGPVEASWWNSSDYPFAAMRLLALTRPAKFFALFADRDLYKYSTEFDQYFYNGRYRLDANGVQVYGDGTSKASYINWIVDYNRITGTDSTLALETDLQNLDVRLCYRMASFSDKQYLKIYTEKSSPISTNASLQIPPESYQLLVYKNQPFDRLIYSSVVIQVVDGGYAVFGYSTARPYFNTFTSIPVGQFETYSVASKTIQVPANYTDTVTQIPYGFVFTTESAVANFLLSYGKFLESQGFEFTNQTNGYLMTWSQMVYEFIYWSQQGWGTGSLINLNPLAIGLSVFKEQAVVDNITSQTAEHVILDQNRKDFPTRELNIVRVDNNFTIQPLNNQSLSFIDMRYTSFESMIVFDNASLFGDLIFEPITGARQSRLYLSGTTTTEWDGSVNAQGFILNQNNIPAWTGLKTYAKGEIVTYKGAYWSAATIVQPSAKFNYNDWNQSDYTFIEQGLLANLANKADQLSNSYDINSANLIADNDLLSYGLIGFRPRQYMAALNLDDVSQLNIYREFLGTKGTKNSVDLFGQAKFNKEVAEYKIFENWAIQRGVYGANANRSFFDLRLNRALLSSNPSLVQIVVPNETSTADQQIFLSDVWKSSFPLTTTALLPTTTTLPTDISLPSAGYVNIDDVDITVFDLDDPANLNANIDSVIVGTSIWVAKVNNYNWNIYRAEAVPGTIQHVCDNLNGTSRVIFSKQHGLITGNRLIIRFFDTEVNGVYTVLSVPNLTTVNIALDLAGDRTVVDGTGIGFTLETMRVDQASDVIDLPYAQQFLPGAKVWVDDNGQGLWEVLEKQNPFTDRAVLAPVLLDATEQYGASVAQATNRSALFVGSPRYGFGLGTAKGGIYLYVRNAGDQYVPISPIGGQDTVLTLSTTGLRGYGNAVDAGNQTFAIGGASASQSPLIAASNFVTNGIYTITALGTTNFVAIGATATAVVTGTISNGSGSAGTILAVSVVTLGALAAGTYISGAGVTPGTYVVAIRPGVVTASTTYTTLTGTSVAAAATYTGVAVKSTSGAGTGATFTIVKTGAGTTYNGATTITVVNGGTNYAVGDTITIGGNNLGGANTTNDLTFTLATSVNSSNYWTVSTSQLVSSTTITGQPAVGSTFTATGAGSGTGTAELNNNGYAVVLWRDPTAGAANTSPWSQPQLLTLPGTTPTTTPGAGEFGYSVAMSLDERWLYVGAPGLNTVYAYGQVQWQDQVLQYIANGTSNTADISDTIQINNANQIAVLKNNALLTLTTDYTVDAGFTTVTFITMPAAGDVITISRKYVKTFSPSGTTYSLSPWLFTATANNIYSFSVTVDSVLQRPNIDYTYSGTTLTFASAPSNDIIVTSQFYYQLAGTITPTVGVIAGARFGASVQCSTDGRQVIIGCSSATVNALTEAGSVYVVDRNVQKFIRQDDSSNTYTVLGTVAAPVSVLVNNVFLTNQTNSIVGADNTFSVSGNNITINKDLFVGDVIEIEINQFVEQQLITEDTVAEFTNYGQSLDLCPYNCSLYVGAPQDSSIAWKGGVVERSVNQSRSYGTISSNIANPSLTAGQTLRVNNVDIAVPASPNNNIAGLAAAINGGIPGTNSGAPNATAVVSTDGYLTIFVTNTDAAPEGNKLQVAPGSVGSVFSALGFVTFEYTQTIASPRPVEFGQFGYSVAVNDTALNLVVGSPKGTLYSVMVFDYNTTTEKANTTFDGNSTAFFSSVSMVIGTAAAGSFVVGQQYTIVSVGTTDFTAIGAISNGVGIRFTATGVGSGTGTASYYITRSLTQSGAVYTYDYLPSNSLSVANPGKFIFGQQVETDGVSYLDQYGYAVSYNSGVLVATAPGEDFEDSTYSEFGAAYIFENPTQRLAWEPITIQQPVVDIRLLTSVYMYDRISSAKSQFFDFFDPLQGKVLGAAQENIDFISAIDPASYNVGPVNNRGDTWAATHVGEVWWDISTVRFINPNQDNPTYASRRWGQVFPGSTVDVYQWISSTVPPANYTGVGTPYSTISYVVSTRLNQSGTFVTEYYFWVRGITETASRAGKTLSVATVASYIQEPKASGISYVAPINSSTIAIYNAIEYILAADTIISVEFDQVLTDANVHTEYELIAQGQDDAFLSDNLYRKLQDSFCGVDTTGNKVPDPNLNYAQRYGVQFRPRQSMFVDRFLALKNYIQRANDVFALYPITEIRSFALLNSAEPEPSATSGEWNLRVANLEILGFQDIYAVPLGYKYLVVTNSLNRGLWTINEVKVTTDPTVRELVLSRVQNYNTPQYWSYVNWYQPGYNSSSIIVAEVPNYATLETLSVAIGSSVKVTANAQGKFEIYLRTDTGWDRVGLEDGTIEISAEIYDYALGRFGFDVEVFDAQYFDQEPVIETRKIIQAINEELFVDELKIERNKSLTLMFNFILSELLAPEWLIKTSLIDVQHKVRDLVPYQNYIRDNQDFVSDYLQEVKPYHVQVRAFNLTYDGIDNFQGSLTDFDLPAYYDTNLTIPQYVSPILLPYQHATAQAFNTLSDTAPNSTLWPEWPYSQWFDNYLLHVDSITVTNQGTGYTIAPTVLIVPAEGDTGSGAEATAVLNSSGNVVSITLINGGSGYRSTPTVAFDGGNGTGVAAYPQMDNGLVRSFRTVLKYDRYQYQTSVLTWSPDGTYENGTLVRYDDRVWQADSTDGSTAVVGPEFNLEDWTLVDAATLSGVNRTMGFYVPGVNEFGLDLQLLVDGTSYPGVQVWGDYFLGSAPASPTLVCTATNATTNEITCVQTARLSLGDPIRFYGTVFGGIVAGTVYYVNAIVDATHFTVALAPDGLTFSLTSATGTMIADVPEPIDATYASSFTDQYLGLRPTDINVDGGEFIGPYEGHAPEELVNGSEYDTLDFRVYTRPGADWTGDGHGFAIGTFNYVYDGNALYWGTLVQNPVNIEVSNENTNSDLTPDIDYVVDWEAQTITAVPGGGIANGDVISITAYEMGGGNQLFRGNYNGTEVNNSVVIPVNANEIYELVLFVNGTNVSGATWTSYTDSVPWTYENSYAAQTVVENNQLYYRALQSVPPGILLDDPLYWIEFVPTVQSTVTFPYPMANVKYATTTSLFGTYGYVYDNGTNGVGATLTSYNVYDDYSALSIDGVTPSVGDRILVKDETGTYINDTTQSATFNGIYTVTRVGNSSVYWILTRATDFVDSLDIPSAITLVTSGSTNAATRWVCTSNPSIFVGTTEIDWTRFIGSEAPYGAGDGISITVMGVEDPQYSWSTAVTQYHTATESDTLTNSINLDNSMQGTNVANLVVTVNGKRLQPPEGIEWTGDGTSSSFGLPQRGGGYPQSSINAYTDIQVWLNNVLQVQNYGATVGDYYVTNYDGSNTPGRQVVFFTPPADGAQILISVSTIAQYTVVVGLPNRLLITPLLNLGDQIAITSWNDTSQQDPLTLVFVGPIITGLTVVEPYDSTGYSYPDAASDAPGSFDYSEGVAIPTNDFNLGREGILANRLWVTLDGNRLYPGVDYSVQGQYLILGSGIIGSAQVLAVTEFTESVVPGAIAFRLFQDMRGVQTTFRITASTTTTVAQAVSAVADIIYVADAAALSEPNLTDGIFGVVTIDGERILYRERNLSTNSITGLQRGTAGTAATSHSVNAEVYDMGLGNRQPQEFQNYIVSDTSTGDGSTTIFYAPTIEFDLSDSSFEIDSIEVYVGGNRARNGYYAGQFVIGQTYTIASLGNTNWYAIGLPSDVFPAPGVVFTATGAGTGTGVAGNSLASNYYKESDYDPLAIQFLTANDLPAPGAGVEVVILQRRGVTWYAPGNGTPSNGEALQITDTNAARFLRGL